MGVETNGFVFICIHRYIFNPSTVVPLTLKAWKLATGPPSALHLQTRRERREREGRSTCPNGLISLSCALLVTLIGGDRWKQLCPVLSTLLQRPIEKNQPSIRRID